MDALHNLEIEIQKTLTKINDELAKYTKIHTDNEENSLLIVAGTDEVISDKLIQYYTYLGQKLSFECVLDYIQEYKEGIN